MVSVFASVVGISFKPMLSVFKKYKSYIIAIATIVICIIIVKQCEGEPRIIEKTKTEYVKVTDTVTKTVIDTVPKTVYIERVKTIKGKDSIIYKEKPTDNTIEANKYKTKLESNNATADLEITTTGQLLDVNGTINYTKEIKTIEKTVIRDASGLFLYGETSVIPTFERAAVGLDYQFKNKFIIGASASYNNITKSTYANIKVGFKIF